MIAIKTKKQALARELLAIANDPIWPTDLAVSVQSMATGTITLDSVQMQQVARIDTEGKVRYR